MLCLFSSCLDSGFLESMGCGDEEYECRDELYVPELQFDAILRALCNTE